MSLPPQLEADIKELKDRGFNVNARRDPSNTDRIFIEFESYPLPRGWNKNQTRLLLITDISYPNSKLDMFWVEVDILLEGGKTPQAGEAIETYDGKQWRRFSWHVQKWNPALDSISSYLDTVTARLRQPQ